MIRVYPIVWKYVIVLIVLCCSVWTSLVLSRRIVQIEATSSTTRTSELSSDRINFDIGFLGTVDSVVLSEKRKWIPVKSHTVTSIVDSIIRFELQSHQLKMTQMGVTSSDPLPNLSCRTIHGSLLGSLIGIESFVSEIEYETPSSQFSYIDLQPTKIRNRLQAAFSLRMCFPLVNE